MEIFNTIKTFVRGLGRDIKDIAVNEIYHNIKPILTVIGIVSLIVGWFCFDFCVFNLALTAIVCLGFMMTCVIGLLVMMLWLAIQCCLAKYLYLSALIAVLYWGTAIIVYGIFIVRLSIRMFNDFQTMI